MKSKRFRRLIHLSSRILPLFLKLQSLLAPVSFLYRLRLPPTRNQPIDQQLGLPSLRLFFEGSGTVDAGFDGTVWPVMERASRRALGADGDRTE